MRQQLPQAIENAIDGNALLFTGAGFSSGAINLNNKPFLRASEFADALAVRVGLPKGTGLEDASELFAQTMGEQSLINELHQQFTVKTVQAYHREVAKINWRRVYTTNYDNVLEQAYAREGKKLVPITLSTSPNRAANRQTQCIHLNGYIDQLDRDTLGRELKLTEGSYVTSSIADSEWAWSFRRDMKLARSVFFIGYSLYDLEIKRLIVESEILRDKCFFVLHPLTDEATKRRAASYGTVFLEGVEAFANLVREKRRTYIPQVTSDFNLMSIKEHTAVNETVAITDKAFLGLILTGIHEDALISESLRSRRTFFLERSNIQSVFEAIDYGARVIVLQSDLGNGKSLFLDGVRLKALEHGFRVFETSNQTEDVTLELQQVAELPSKVLVTFEDYSRWLNEIRMFRSNANDHAVIVVTARKAVHELSFDRLIEAAGVANIPEFELDYLDKAEIGWFVSAFNEYGLWGEYAGDSDQKKSRYLSHECRGQIHAILLRLFASPHIGERLQALLLAPDQSKDQRAVVLSVFILTLTYGSAPFEVLVDLWGAELMNNTAVRRSQFVRQFLDFERNEVVAKSPVAAEYLLHNFADPAELVSVMIDLTRQADKGDKYKLLFRDLVKFSSVQAVLPEKGRAGFIIRFYEGTKNLYGSKQNPLFWLQYAIACLFINDLDRSERYFKTAYSLAEKRPFDTFQIDNHYARFLLAQAIEALNINDAMAKFRLARKIINRQIKEEYRYYPYRVAADYQTFFDKFSGDLSQSHLNEVGRAAQAVLEQMESLDLSLRSHRIVRDCDKAMVYILKRVKEKTEKGT